MVIRLEVRKKGGKNCLKSLFSPTLIGLEIFKFSLVTLITFQSTKSLIKKF